MPNFNLENNNPLHKIKQAVKLIGAGVIALTDTEKAKGQDNTLPTKEDSLELLQNTKEVLDYYKNDNGYMKTKEEIIPDYEDIHNASIPWSKENFEQLGDVSTDTGRKKPQEVEFYKKVDENKFYQRESNAYKIDERSPMPLYDKRIRPNLEVTYENFKIGDPLEHDVVNIYTHDPLAITPWTDLSPEDQKLRLEKYGTKGTPYEKKENTSQETDQKALEHKKEFDINNYKKVWNNQYGVNILYNKSTGDPEYYENAEGKIVPYKVNGDTLNFNKKQ